MRTLPTPLLRELLKNVHTVKFLFVFEFTSGTQRWTDYSENLYYGGGGGGLGGGPLGGGPLGGVGIGGGGSEGNWYESRGITFDALKLSANPQIDNITIDIDDVDHKITDIILTEEIKDKPISIYLVMIDKNLQCIGIPDLLFYGYCDSSNKPIGSTKVSIQCYNDMIHWKRLTPRRTTSGVCQWEYKNGPTKKLGTDANTYTCILDHVADTVNKPITGGSWATYWSLAGANGGTWTDGDWCISGTCKYSGPLNWCDKSWDRCLVHTNTDNFGGCRFTPGLEGKEIWWGQSEDPRIRAILKWKSMGH